MKLNKLKITRKIAMLAILFTSSTVMAQSGELWSNPGTWPNGSIPKAGDSVVIPEDKHVILDTSTPQLDGILVKGKLSFADINLEVSTAYLIAMGKNSEIEIGTKDSPFISKAIVTLHEGSELPKMGMHSWGVKTFGTHDGKISIYGASSSKKSWTRLAVDFNPGETDLLLVDSTGWQIGDSIVVAPSGFDACHAERFVILNITGNKLTLNKPAEYKHLSKQLTVAGKTLDMRAEVGLLSRNVIFQGDISGTSVSSKHYNCNYLKGKGGHTIIMGESSAHIEGAEFRFMGQTGIPGRYPIHWHHAGPQYNDIVKNNSVHDSFQRAIVAHRTDGVVVDNNVAFQISNHGFVPAEDGDEIDNTYSNNLGILSFRVDVEDFAFSNRQKGERDQSEYRPAMYWTTSPYVNLIGNVCAGVVSGHCYFYDARGAAGWRSFKEISKDKPAGVFENNYAHSVYSVGGGNDRYPPLAKGFGLFAQLNTNYRIFKLPVFNEFYSYKAHNGDVWLEGRNQQDHVLKNSFLADSTTGVQIFDGEVYDTVIVGDSGIGIQEPRNKFGAGQETRGGIHFMDGQGGTKKAALKNIKFLNPQDAAVVFQAKEGGDGNSESFITMENLEVLDDSRPLLMTDNQPGETTRAGSFVNLKQVGDINKTTIQIHDLDGSLLGGNYAVAIPIKIDTSSTGNPKYVPSLEKQIQIIENKFGFTGCKADSSFECVETNSSADCDKRDVMGAIVCREGGNTLPNPGDSVLNPNLMTPIPEPTQVPPVFTPEPPEVIPTITTTPITIPTSETPTEIPEVEKCNGIKLSKIKKIVKKLAIKRRKMKSRNRRRKIGKKIGIIKKCLKKLN